MFNGWKITNILDVGLCELDTADGPYNKTGYRLEHREDGFAITVGLMEYISGWSALEILYWLNEKQAIPRRYDRHLGGDISFFNTEYGVCFTVRLPKHGEAVR